MLDIREFPTYGNMLRVLPEVMVPDADQVSGFEELTLDDRGIPEVMDPDADQVSGFEELSLDDRGIPEVVDSDVDQVSGFGELTLDDRGAPTYAAVTTVPGGDRPQVDAPIQLRRPQWPCSCMVSDAGAVY
jgi:hypothetical protein